jgi:hypothetical protein
MDLRLPGLPTEKAIVLNDPRPKIRCAYTDPHLGRCPSTTLRAVRLADAMPAPSDPGWFEVLVEGSTGRTVLFACSQRHASAVGASYNVATDLSAFSEHAVLPEG